MLRVPVGFPLASFQYVANAPISNSFPLKKEGGRAGVGTTSFDGGGPAKETTACDARATTAKAADFHNINPAGHLH